MTPKLQEEIEALYWRFDAMRNGYGEFIRAPKSDRDAFKCVCRELVEKVKRLNHQLHKGVGE
jgi:hypothetical protein